MNKQKLTTIFQSLLTATLICISVIFIIKYIFEVKLVWEELENMSNQNNESYENDASNPTTEISADVTDKEDIDLSKIPLDERIYKVNSKEYKNDDLMLPVRNYNYAIMMNNSVYLSSAYTKTALAFIIKETSYSLKEYTEKIYTTYTELFGDDFIISNSLINTTVLTDDELSDMRSFYNLYYDEPINIEYAVLIESECSITYTEPSVNEQSELSEKQTQSNSSETPDENDKKLNTHSEREFFISYYYNDSWYLDYIYTDYYFYN